MSRLVRNRALRRRMQSMPVLRRAGKAIEDAVLVAFWGVCARLSPARASRLGAALVGALGPLTDKHEKIRTNLRLAFPDMPAAQRAEVERDVWRNMGAGAGEYPHLASFKATKAPDGPGIEIAIPAHLEPNFTGERLTVFATAHLGNWEVLAAAPKIWGSDLAVVYTPISDGFADRRLHAYRLGMGSQLLPRDGSARMLLRHLKNGNPIGIVADHRMEDGEALPFFGHTKLTTLSPARLALKTGADFVPIRVMRLGPARFRIEPADAIVPPADATDETAKAIAMMTAFNRQLQAWITERPGEWMCGKRAFPKAVVKALRRSPASGPAIKELPNAH